LISGQRGGESAYRHTGSSAASARRRTTDAVLGSLAPAAPDPRPLRGCSFSRNT
jgi:hypothetical protein